MNSELSHQETESDDKEEVVTGQLIDESSTEERREEVMDHESSPHQESGTASEPVHAVVDTTQQSHQAVSTHQLSQDIVQPQGLQAVATQPQELQVVAGQQSSQDTVQHLEINLPEWLANSDEPIVIICSDNDVPVTDTEDPNQQQKEHVPTDAKLDDEEQKASTTVIAQPSPTPPDDPQEQVDIQVTDGETLAESQAPNVTVVIREAKQDDGVKLEKGKAGDSRTVSDGGQQKVDLNKHDNLAEKQQHDRKENHGRGPVSQVSRRSKRKAAMSPRRRWCRAGCCDDGKQHGVVLDSSGDKSTVTNQQNAIDLACAEVLCDAINQDAIEKAQLSAENSDGPSSPKRIKTESVVLPLDVTPIVKKKHKIDNSGDHKDDAISPDNAKTIEQITLLDSASSDYPVPVNLIKVAKLEDEQTATDILSAMQTDLQSDKPSDTASDKPVDTPEETPEIEAPDTPDDETEEASVIHFDVVSDMITTDEQTDQPSDDTPVALNTKFECICGGVFTHKKSLIRHFRRKKARADGVQVKGSQHYAKYPIAIYPNTKAPDRKPKQTSFPCPYCPKVLHTKGGIDYHIKSHTGAKPAECSLCGKSFKSKQILDQHFVIHTNGELPFKCEHCGRTYLTSTRLRAHEKIHGEKQFKCQFCHHAFVMLKDLNKHMRVHTGEKPFKCDYCEVRFHFSQDRKRHHLTNHGDKAEFRCDICPKFFFKEHELDAHVKFHGGEEQDFKCKICGQNFTSFTTMRNHRMTHSTDFNPFACRYETCDLIFKCSNDRYLHERKNHDMNLFKCQYCSLTFKKQNAFEEHQKKHLEASYVCRVDPECGERFQQAHNRLRHEKNHSQDANAVKRGRGPGKKMLKKVAEVIADFADTEPGAPETVYQCGVCWKTYKNYPSLRDHVREHGEDMPYGCRVQGCEKRFKRVYHRRKHEQTHSTDEIIHSVIDSRLKANDENINNSISEEEEIIIQTEEEQHHMQQQEQQQQEQQQEEHHQQEMVIEPDMSDPVAATEVVEATEITIGDETQIAVQFVMH